MPARSTPAKATPKRAATTRPTKGKAAVDREDELTIGQPSPLEGGPVSHEGVERPRRRPRITTAAGEARDRHRRRNRRSRRRLRARAPGARAHRAGGPASRRRSRVHAPRFRPGSLRRGGRDAHPGRPRSDAELLRPVRPRDAAVRHGQPEDPRRDRRPAHDGRRGGSGARPASRSSSPRRSRAAPGRSSGTAQPPISAIDTRRADRGRSTRCCASTTSTRFASSWSGPDSPKAPSSCTAS